MLRLLLIAAIVLVLFVPTTAFADEQHASCLGIEASAISPPRSSNEAPGGMPQVHQELREAAVSLAVPVGSLYAGVAHLHEHSHAACDKALGG